VCVVVAFNLKLTFVDQTGSPSSLPATGQTSSPPSPRKHYVTVEGKRFWKVRVVGIMTAANIRKACGDQQMKPVCDFKYYNDAHCLHATSYRHYSHPSHDVRLGISKAAAKNIYWYTGRHNTGSILNTGKTHRWARRNVDKNGFTMCAEDSLLA